MYESRSLSDIMCTFWYIGKRRFERALQNFAHRDEVAVIWKSFQLNPEMKTDPEKNISEYRAAIDGRKFEQARQINVKVTEMAKEEGFAYDFDAHRLIQMAKSIGKGDETEEQLFKADVTELTQSWRESAIKREIKKKDNDSQTFNIGDAGSFV